MKKLIDGIKKYLPTILVMIGLVTIYFIISKYELLSPFLFPPISAIVKSFLDSVPTMLLNMLYTFRLLIPSVLLSLLIGLFIGLALGMNKRLREILSPILYGFSVVPAILMSPFALLLAPSFYAASMFMVIYNTIWGTLFATINGVMTIDKRYLEAADTLEIYGLKRLVKVILPAASPTILTGFISSLRGSFTILVFAEMYGSEYGLGYYVKKNAEYGLYNHVWAGFIFMAIILVIVMKVFEGIKNKALYWTIDQ